MGKRRLNVLRRRWRAESLAYCGLLTLAGSVLLTAAMHLLAGWPYRAEWAIGAALGVIVVCRSPYWRITLPEITRYLDRRIPELEESCGLLLRPPAELNALEGIQAQKIEKRL